MTQRLVNPIHFFDARGQAIVNQELLEIEVRRLKLENQKLRQSLRKTVAALKARQAPPSPEKRQ